MINIIRSVNYSLKKDRGVLMTILIMAAFPYLMMAFLSAAQGSDLQSLTPSYYFASQNMAMITVLFYLGIVIISCKVMAGDFADKTINYEILSGHDRTEVFSSRVVVSVIWGTIIPFVLTVLPLCVFGLFNGWGMETDQKDVIIRTLLSIFPLFRLCALNIMFASVTENAGKGIALGFMSDIVISIITELEDAYGLTTDYGLGIINIMVLLTSLNSRELVIDGKPVTVFDTAVTGGMVWGTILFSLGAAFIYLLISYIIFQKRDRS